MLPEEQCTPLDDVELLAKSFAKCLADKGFMSSDLVCAATVLIEQAIEIEKTKQNQQPLKVISKKDRPPLSVAP